MDFIINTIFYYILYVLITPILTFLHELGHVVFALLFSKGNVNIIIGNADLNKEIRINRLRVYIKGYNSILDLSYGRVNYASSQSKLKSIIAIAAGPIVSLLIAILSISAVSQETPYIINQCLNGIFIFSMIQFFMTILPMRYTSGSYAGTISDGYRILVILRTSS